MALFVDEAFPANNRSLGKNVECVWLRPHEFFKAEGEAAGAKPELYQNGHIGPTDIQQGGLGDCYFLSSLSVLSENPERIMKLFRDNVKEENERGKYTVTFFLDGTVTKVVVDDLIPCDPKTRMPLFSRNKGPELWVMLLEKAYAKVYGSFRAIESGVPGDALADLTGAPFETLKSSDLGASTIWKKLDEAERKGYAICCGVPSIPNFDAEKAVGLVEGHAYAMLDVQSHGEGDQRLVKLRNPWGKFEWKGAWSDSDKRWTPELKQKLGWTKGDDGIFFMDTTDFVKYFDQVTVLFLDDKWNFTSTPVELKAPSAVFDIDVTEQSPLFLTMHQRRGKTTVSCRLCVVEAATGKPCGGTAETFLQAETISSKMMTLAAGKYHVLAQVFPDHTRHLPVPFVVSCYSKSDGVRLSVEDHGASAKPPFPFTLPEFAAKYGMCESCKQPLSGSFFTVNGKKYHPQCFACSSCKKALEGAFVVRDGKFMCKRCATMPGGAAAASRAPSARPATTTAAKKDAAATTPKVATAKGKVAAVAAVKRVVRAPPRTAPAAAPAAKEPPKATAPAPATTARRPAAKAETPKPPTTRAATAKASKPAITKVPATAVGDPEKKPIVKKRTVKKTEHEDDTEDGVAILVESGHEAEAKGTTSQL